MVNCKDLKSVKKKRFLPNNGCKLKDNLIIATIDGKPHVKGNMFVCRTSTPG